MSQPDRDDSPRQERESGGNVPSGWCWLCDYPAKPCPWDCFADVVPVQWELVGDVSD